jgi:hypothetical protein
MRIRFPLLLVAAVFAPGLCHACSCGDEIFTDDKPAIAKALSEADAVFVGRIESAELASKLDSGIEGQHTGFYVVRSWKGETSTRIYIQTSLAHCGFGFPSSGEFLVYAYTAPETGYFRTTVCTRTKPSSQASKEISILDELEAAGASRTSRSTRSRAKTRAPG